MLCTICLILLSVLELVLGRSDLEALLEVKKGFQEDPSGKVLVSWDSKSLASNGCPQDWYGISCSEGHVTSIVLNGVGLVGVLDFPAIGNLKLLRNLSVANNQLRGNVTAEVGAIESLEYLDLSRNMFSGSIPSEFTGLKNLLMYLDLHSNAFSGDVTSLLSQLGGVVYVDISGNEFFGSLDLEVGIGGSGFVSTIRYLNISHNKLTGELFPHDGMPYFDSLEVFDASNNQFVGNLPSFNFIVSLQILRLGNNKLSGSLPQGLLQKSSMVLSELDISLNELEGPIGNINAENLKVLNLSSNKLSGPLPIRVGRCAVIDLSNNMLSGNVSRIQGWGNNVEVITLSSNLLVGSLSSQTSQFLRLTSLKISNNSLDGTLPPILCTYPELKTIDISTNVFSGSLPACLFNSSRLSNVNLSSNKFTGTIPMEELTPQNPILTRSATFKSAVRAALIAVEKANPKGSSEKKGSPLSAGPEIGNQGLPVPVRQNEAFHLLLYLLCHPPIYRLLGYKIIIEKALILSRFLLPIKWLDLLHLFDSTLKFTAEDLSCAPAEAVGKRVVTLTESALSAAPLPSYSVYKNSKTLNPLSLVDRLKIAVDVARCLCYLHHESAIPHGNLKSTNILVETSTHNALLTDYSLHRIMTSAGTAEQVLTAAALGYRPPEFASTSKPCPSLKGDVYAFGVILLELLTGRNSAEIVPGNAQVLDLTEWVRLLAAQNRSLECFDPSVLGTGSMERVYAALDDMLCTALRCILPADERPDMRVIFEELSSVSVENNTTEK
nr:probable LRR receptor-like serine/threonine-protein kinase At4g20940 [Ipomoea batatas]